MKKKQPSGRFLQKGGFPYNFVKRFRTAHITTTKKWLHGLQNKLTSGKQIYEAPMNIAVNSSLTIDKPEQDTAYRIQLIRSLG